MSSLDEELQQTEYRSVSITPLDPGTLMGVFNAEVNYSEYRVTLRIDVSRWPNDWDRFMVMQRLASQVMHEFNRSFRGYADAHRNASEDDIPF